MATNLALHKVLALASRQGDIVSRRQLYGAGLTRSQVRANISARRWRRTGRQTVATHTGPLTEEGTWWCAVFEVGPQAALDGVTALLASGLRGWTEKTLHVITPKSGRPRHPKGVTVHESRRFQESDVVAVGIRRVRPAVAAVHAALWAASDRQAAVILAMTVQQKLAPVSEIASALDAVRRHRRRRFLRDVLGDIAGGSQSLGELDVLSGLRRRRLPEPSRQEIRRLASGRIYLDIEWEEWRLVVEVDGEQHDEPEQRLADTLRDLDVTAGGETVLRIPLLAWRLNEEAVLDRLTAIFVSRGWRHAA